LEHSRPSRAGNRAKNMFYNLPVLISFFLILSLPSNVFAESVNAKVREGVSQYHEGAYKESVENFSSARVDRPEDSRIAYNLGNAHYKEGKFQEALQAYTQSALDEENQDIRKKSIYNTGNSLVKLEKLEEAASAYKKVLALDPSDMDAKYNLEYVRQQLEEKEKQKQDSDQQKGEDNPSEKDQDPQSKNESGQQKEDQPPPPDNADSESNENADSKSNENSDPSKESTIEAKISEKEAEQILEGLTEDLKDISRMQAGKTKSAYQGNDW
jgi:Ca-activated chloride channel homolog